MIYYYKTFVFTTLSTISGFLVFCCYIILSTLKIWSVEVMFKAFSICTSHLLAVWIFQRAMILIQLSRWKQNYISALHPDKSHGKLSVYSLFNSRLLFSQKYTIRHIINNIVFHSLVKCTIVQVSNQKEMLQIFNDVMFHYLSWNDV
jgi:hypothetical protein